MITPTPRDKFQGIFTDWKERIEQDLKRIKEFFDSSDQSFRFVFRQLLSNRKEELQEVKYWLKIMEGKWVPPVAGEEPED